MAQIIIREGPVRHTSGHRFILISICTLFLLSMRFNFFFISAGRSVQNEELENMLESGNPAIFTQGVSRRPSQWGFSIGKTSQ